MIKMTVVACGLAILLLACGMLYLIPGSEKDPEVDKPIESQVLGYYVESNHDSSPGYSFKDGRFYYYTWYLGMIREVPLQSQSETSLVTFKYTDGTFKQIISSTHSTTQSVNQAISSISSKSIGFSHSDLESTTHGLKAGIEVAEMGIKAQIEGSFEHCRSKTDVYTRSSETSFSQSVETVVSNTNSMTRTTEIEFNENYESGWYRYVYCGSLDVFYTLVYDTKTKTYDVFTQSIPTPSGFILEYCENEFFTRDQDTFTYPIPDVVDLVTNHVPEKFVGNTDDENRLNIVDEENPFIIGSVDEFVQCIKMDGPDVYYRLVDDIDFGGNARSYLYKPLDVFRGNLDGNGFSIRNYSVVQADSECFGFFKINEGSIKNLRFIGCTYSEVSYTSSSKEVFLNVGIVCGENNGTIENVVVDSCALGNNHLGTTKSDAKYRLHSGLICGENGSDGMISRCGSIDSMIYSHAMTKKKIADSYAAGIAGRSYSIIDSCYSYNNALNAVSEGSGSLWSYSGGIVGRSFESGSIEFCLSANNTLHTDCIGGKKHMYSDAICPELNGSQIQSFETTDLPDTFPSALWIRGAHGFVTVYGWH